MVHSESVDDELHAWVSKSASQALGYALTLVRHQQVAEDLVQDCYRRLFAKVDVYDLQRDGTKLLFRSITNACINWTQRHRSDASLDQIKSSGFAGRSLLVDRHAAQPVETVIQHELQNAIEAAMNELPVEQRAAIELRSLGHSITDVAEALTISHGNARVLLHRARTALTSRLRPYLEENTQ